MSIKSDIVKPIVGSPLRKVFMDVFGQGYSDVVPSVVTPTNINPPQISGLGYNGQTLTATQGTWENATSVSGQWYADGLPLFGQTGLTYTVTVVTEGRNFQYVETAEPFGVTAVSNEIHNWVPWESNMSLRLDAANANTISASSGVLSGWNSDTASATPFEATSPNQPSTGVESLNSLNVVTFDNVNDKIDVFGGAVPPVTNGSNLQIHVVAKIPAIGGVNFGTFFGQINFAGNSGINVSRSGTGSGLRVQIRNGTTTFFNLDIANQFDGDWHIYSFCAFTSPTNTIEMYRDGVLQGSRTWTGASFESTVGPFNVFAAAGSVAELFTISATPRTQDLIDRSVGMLAHRWGLTTNLAAGHLYKSTAPTSSASLLALTAFDGYGQSWMDGNGNNGAYASLVTAQAPSNVFMLNGGAGINANPATATDFEAAREDDPALQTVIGPLTLRYYDEVGSGLFFARQSGVGGQSLAQLATPPLSFYDGTSTGYANWLIGLQKSYAIARSKGQSFRLKYIAWCQGEANASTAYATYKLQLGQLLDKIQSDVLAITGYKTTFILLQAPGGLANSKWENLQAQIDLFKERSDAFVGFAGWSLTSIDGIHYDNVGAINGGEMLALKAKSHADGVLWEPPTFTNAVRVGNTITLDVAGRYDVVADTSVNTTRHYVGGSPVPNHGFEYFDAGNNEIAINSVVVAPRQVTITLESGVAGRLGFAWSNKIRGDSKPTNRGTIRSTWLGTSTYTGQTLRDWVCSGYWDL